MRDEEAHQIKLSLRTFNVTMMDPVKVFIIEESAITRFILQSIIGADRTLTVAGTTTDPLTAERRILESNPDVILLDLEVERAFGLRFLKKLMATLPKPVIIISDNSPKARANAFQALEYGALDIFEKPGISTLENLLTGPGNLCRMIHAAAEANLNATHEATSETLHVSNAVAADATLSKRCYLIGCSTGGPQLLRKIFTSVRVSIPGCVVAQPMSAQLTKSLVESFSNISNVVIKEAANGDYIRNNQVLIIPGDCYGAIKKDSQGYFIHLSRDSKDNRCDALFASACDYAPRVTGFLLTGMGNDGAKGLLALKRHGATTIAQDATSCAVYEMPKHAIALEAAQLVLSSEDIVKYINKADA